jgi:carbon-monoxide dehydrogenase large subunit
MNNRPDLRVEDRRLLTGAGRYVADLCDAETLHCSFVRSPIAHGRIVDIDLGLAREMDGVVGVFTADDLDLPDLPGNTGRGPGAEQMTRPPLARDRVRHVGEGVAVVVAETAVAAEDAAGLVFVDIDAITPVVSATDALRNEVLLFEGAGTNVVARTSLEHGDIPVSAEVSITVDVASQRLAPTSLEPPTFLAVPDGEGRIHVWCGHQAPHRLHNQLAEFAGIPVDAIRVTAPDVGGAFGMKGMLFPEYLVVARLAIRLRRPVVWLSTRRENMAMGTHGRAQHHRVTLEGTAAGRIQRARIEIVADTGAYPHNGSQIPMFSRLTATGLYDIGRVEVETTAVVTNQAPTGSYRGAGRPEAALAIERAVDAFALEAGLDPVDVRFLNLIQPEAMPYTTATGALYDSGDYPDALRMAIDMLGLAELKAEQAQRRARDADPMGIGIGAFIERAGGALEAGEYAKVEIDPIGRRVIVRTGSTDQGQGHETVWRRLVRDIFETGEVTILAGDTAEVAEGVGTFASRSAQVGASAAVRTAERVLELAKQRAADHLEAAPADLVYEGGTFSVVGSPGAEVSIFDLAEGEPLADEEMYVPHAQTFPYGVHAAVVDVSRETGEVKVRRIVAVDDCGKVLNEMLVEGQLLGSLAQGLGQALLEGIRYDSDGQLLSSSLMDYKVPTAADMPPVIHDRLEHPAPSNPLGVKGAGEAGCIGLPPAILNATLDALAPLGVTDLQFPLRPVDVWTAIQEATSRG